jgi:hypothetical protein
MQNNITKIRFKYKIKIKFNGFYNSIPSISHDILEMTQSMSNSDRHICSVITKLYGL